MEPVIIKKYTNRRLYHTGEKQYITLEEVEQIIREGHEVKVIDNQTKEDITQETLLQIIFSSEKPKSLFPSDILHQIIRLQEEKFQEFLRLYLKSILDHFAKLQKNWSQQFGALTNLWSSLVPGMSLLPIKNNPLFSLPDTPESEAPEAENLADIRARLLDYEKKIQELSNQLKSRQEQSDL